jgi:hypothetical protein
MREHYKQAITYELETRNVIYISKQVKWIGEKQLSGTQCA